MAEPKATITTTTPTNFLKSDHTIIISVPISSATRDAGATPTTSLRKGLTLGIITTGTEWLEYTPAASDGTETATGILMDDINILDATGTAVDRNAHVLIHGRVDTSKLFLWDAAAAVDLKGAIITT